MPRDSWPRYLRAAREAAGLSIAELARRIGASRETVSRWESGRYRPDDADVVRRAAEVLGVPLDDALAAAGFRPGAAPPAEPEREPDPVLDWIRRHPRLSPDRKRALIRHVLLQRARDEDARLDDLRQMIGDH